MNTINVFEYQDYRAFMVDYIQSRPHAGHGEKSKIAEAIRCHNAYLSQILSGKSDLSLEQAHDFTEYLDFQADEVNFFLLLVQFARAGTAKLKTHYREQINQVIQHRVNLKNRLKPKETLPKEDQATYFSAWYYSVIHLMIGTLKGFQSTKDLEKVLDLPPAIIRNAIHFLETRDLISKKADGQFGLGTVDIYLGSDSSMILAHHTNWRLQAVRAIEAKLEHELHYSSVVTINEEDFHKIRKILVEGIEKVRKNVDASKNENTVSVLTMDWFKLY